MKLLSKAGLVLACVGVACGGSGSSAHKDVSPEVISNDLAKAETVVDTTPPEDRPVGEKKLEFCDDKGETNITDDGGAPVVGKNIFNLILGYNQARDLYVCYRQGAEPVANAAITWELVGDTLGVGQLNAAMTYSSETGLSSNRLSNPVQKIEQFQVKVCVSDEANLCIYYNVAVDPKKWVPLTVGFAAYKGAYPLLDSAEIRLYKQDVKTGKPTCADLKLDQLPPATVGSPTISLNQTYGFLNLPNFGDKAGQDLKQTYTVVGLASVGSGPIQAAACDDVQGKVEWGGKRYVELTLSDLAPRIVGSFAITSTFDLVSGLPPDVANVVYAITNFFKNPTAELMSLICNAGKNNSTLSNFCGYVFNDPQNPNIDDLTGTGDVIFQIVNAVLLAILDKNCPYKDDPTLCGKIWYTAEDVSTILTSFQLLATFTFSKEPDATGLIADTTTKEVWHSVRLRWTLGMNCPPNDDNCGWKQFSFSSVPGIEETISGTFTAHLTPAWKLSIDKHHLNLKYGALIDFAIEKWILPKLFGDGTDGLPAVESYEQLIGSLLAGKACLQDMSCCATFAVNVSNQTSGVTKQVVEGACTALIETGSKYLRKMLTDLDATPQNFAIATLEPCAISDLNKDMKFDQLGDKLNPCKWDSGLTIGSATYAPEGTFYGKSQGN